MANSRISYSISGVAPYQGRNLFYINPNNGQLHLGQSFNTDTSGASSYQVVVTATDFGTPPLSGAATMNINVVRNTQAPVFNSASYRATIDQTLGVGSSVLTMSASDGDTQPPYNVISYSLVGDGNAPSFFRLDGVNSGLIIVKDTLTKDSSLSYVLRVVATDGGNIATTATATIIVNRNLNRPTFVRTSLAATIVENFPLATSIAKVQAVDSDILAPHNQVTYSIIGNQNAVNYFAVSSRGEISLKRSPTDTTTNTFQVNVSAQDSGLPAPLGSQTNALVTVTISRNQNPPIFFNSSYSVAIPETSTVGSSVIQISATDSDSNPQFNQIRYTVIGDDSAGTFFSISPITGLLSTQASLQSENVDRYSFSARAIDRGTPTLTASSNASVVINVVRNQNGPAFVGEPYGRSIRQDLGVGSSVIQINAVDPDTQASFGDISYSIIGIDTAPSFFSIDSVTGLITLRASVATDSTTEYRVLVRVEDSGSPPKSDITVVTITVNRNLAAPVFQALAYNITILETQNLGDTIVTARATDSDLMSPNNAIVYSGVGTARALEYFYINVVTGDISVRRSLIDDTTANNDKYTLTVAAQDKGVPVSLRATLPTIVNIYVIRNQFGPVFANTPYSDTISQATAVGTRVFTVRANDDDLRAPYNIVQYSLIGDDNAPNFFTINPVTGEIATRATISSDTSPSYRLRVMSYDGGNPSRNTYEVVTLTVDRNLFAPAWLSPSGPGFTAATTIFESADFNTPVFQVSATDNDAAAPYNTEVYSLVGDSSALTYFSVDANSGHIRLKTSLLQDTAQQYTLLVRVTDDAQPQRPAANTATVLVNVLRNKFTPFFMDTPYSRPISENLAIGSSVVTVTALDNDPQNTFERVNYEIIGDDAAPVYFNIAQTTGTLSISQSLVGVAESTFYVRVRAYDNGLPIPRSNTTVVTVTIRRNLNAPVISPTLYEKVIPDTTPLGTVVTTIGATDADLSSPHNVIRFFTSSPNSLADEFFFLDAVSGDVSVKKSLTLDTTQNSVYTMAVRASDTGIPPLTSQEAQVRIQVTRNIHAPRFFQSQYEATLPEMRSVGAVIAQLTVSDADTVTPFNAVTLRAVGDDLATTYFGINQTGSVFVQRDLRSDTLTFYRLRVEARDGGSPARSATVLVNINVQRNLYAPVFNPARYEETIMETTGLGVSLVRVLATDADTRAPHNVSRFSISQGSSSSQGRDYFIIDSVSGVVTLRQSLMTDNTQATIYTFNVDATDTGVPSLSSGNAATVIINVVRNRNPPFFIGQPYSTYINRTLPVGAVVYDLDAQDSDIRAPYNTIEYDVIGDDVSPVFFTVEAQSGQIRLTQSILMESELIYPVRIRARDGGNPRLTATALVSVIVNRNLHDPSFLRQSYDITILETTAPGTSFINVAANDADITAPYNVVRYYFASSVDQFYLDDVSVTVLRNNNPPTFVSEPYTIDLTSNTPVSTSLVQVAATDADVQDPYNRIRFTIIGDDAAPSLFTIDGATGVIRLNSNINTDSSSIYKIRVLAQDGGSPSLSDTTVVSVNVTRNLFPPEFRSTFSNVAITENQALGESFFSVVASDNDVNIPNNVVEYTLSGNDAAKENFQVGSLSGQISLLRSVSDDGNRPSTYTLTITGRDMGIPPRAAINTATVTVSVARNNHAPTFNGLPYLKTISRTLGASASILQVTSVDADIRAPFNQVTLSVVGDDSAPNLFTLDDTGTIRVANNVDLAQDSALKYKLRILAYDGGVPSLSATTTVDITVQRNIFPPVFTNNDVIRVVIQENTAVGTLIADVNATDADPDAPNNVFSFSGIGDGDATTYFFVNPVDGRITLLKPVNGSSIYGFRLIVQAQDGGFPQLQSTTIVEISILRDTDSLQFTLPSYTASISENLLVNTVVTSTVAQPGPGVSYILTGYSSGPDYFTINPTTGAILVKKDLRSDLNKLNMYYLHVKASRQFTTGLKTAMTQVNISVTRNENPPVFSTEIYQVTIPETLSLGSSVQQLTATDADSQDILAYSVVPQGNISDIFYLGPSSGLISLRTFLEGGTINVYQFNVIVSDQSQPAKTDRATVIVNILRDSFAPTFVREPYSTNVVFNVPIDTNIFNVEATDRDLQGSIVYETIGYLAGPGYFAVDSRTGAVTVTASLTTDTSSSYVLGVMAYDSARPLQKDYANLTIEVNRNPNPPVFTQNTYARRIPESFALGANLVQVTATDADSHTVHYEIVSANPSEGTQYFYMNKDTGMFTVGRPLTEITSNGFIFNVRAFDDGVPPQQSSTLAQVTISIDRNQFGPLFVDVPYEQTIRETIPVGTSVLQVSARDNDPQGSAFSNISYVLIGDDSMPSYFTLNSVTGTISVRASLTAETHGIYQGRVVAYDGGAPPRSATAVAKIRVLRNLFEPQFSERNYETEILETIGVGTSILQVRAFDNDTRPPFNTVQYEMQSGARQSDIYFQVDSSSGAISVRAPLTGDTQNQATFQFQVLARDLGTPFLVSSLLANVRINVQRNLNPPFFLTEPYQATINFNTPAGSSVFTVSTRDNDLRAPFNTVSYTVIGDDNAPNMFTIGAQSGDISTNSQDLQSDTASEYKLRVLARDGGFPSLTATTTVLINVERNLNVPRFLTQNYSVSIYETHDLGLPILQLSAIDLDVSSPYNDVTFNMVGDGQAQEYFAIDPSIGSVYVKKALTLISTKQFVAIVSVRDNAPNPLTAADNAFVTINVVRNDHLPVFVGDSCNRDLSQNVAVGASVTQVAAVDSDSTNTPFGRITYDIIGDDSSPVYFNINPSSGLVSVTRSLSQENVDKYQLRVQARDHGVPFKFNTTVCVLTITRNFRAPVFINDQHSTTVDETLPLGSVILTVNATDADSLAPSNIVRYEAVANTGDEECFLVNEITGQLVLRRALLYSPCTAAVLKMYIRAYDLGVPRLTSSVANVTVIVNRNSFTPEFLNTQYRIFLPETEPSGSLVYNVTTLDRDTVSPFNVVRHSIIGDDSATTFFTIDDVSGQITLAQSILPDTETSYRIRVMATDQGTPARTATATINVQVTRNLFAPRFNPLNYEADIYETQSLGTSIIRVNATDSDTKSPYNSVRYEATGTQQALSYFSIDNVDGTISAQRSLTLDDTDATIYTMTVRATDLGTPTQQSTQVATVRINVLRNNNCPQFINLPANITIPTSVNFGNSLYNITALDNDPPGRFSTLIYDIIGDDNAPVYFSINTFSGAVSALPNLVSDTLTMYRLRVRGRDGGSPSCERYEVLTIHVRRNEHPPTWISNGNFSTTILETHNILSPITQVFADDQDTNIPNNVVIYSLAQTSNYRDIFFVDDVNGNVYLRTSLIGTTSNSYELSLVATDQGSPALSSTPAKLIVNVIRNVNPPIFTMEPYTQNISQNVVTGFQVITVLATDADLTPPYNTLTYDIIGDDSAPTYFVINPSSGVISLSQSISSDVTDQYQIRVRVQDGGSPRLSDVIVVLVNVERNLFPPTFTSNSYGEVILESRTVGTRVLRVSANDLDTTTPNQIVRYGMLGDTIDSTYFMIEAVTGDVIVRRPLTDDTQNTVVFAFQATANDLGALQRNATPVDVTITVRRNQNSPEFLQTSYTTTVTQNHPGGSSVYQTTVADRDTVAPFNVLSFELIGDDSATSFFTINPSSGLITLRNGADLTTDTEIRYIARVLARDGGVPSRSATSVVVINVLRNLFPPVFMNVDFFRTSIKETLTVGSNIADVNATDADTTAPENTIQYSIEGDDVAPEYFFINPNTGEITLLKPVENININLFRIRTTATDGGSPGRSAVTYVEVTVLRETGRLAFTLPYYRVVISENTEVNKNILFALAQPGIASYRVLGISPAPTFFDVSSQIGAIAVRRDLRLDPARLTFYQLQIEATATLDISVQTATTVVNITVTRNENGPVFTDNSYVTSIRDTTVIGTVVLTVTASDMDGDLVDYRMLDSNSAGTYFYLNPRTGQLSTKISLREINLQSFQFQIQAGDQRAPERTSRSNVTIVIERDQQRPQFVDDPYTTAVQETTVNGSTVYQVSAFDADLQGSLTYEITGEGVAPAFFEINSNTGTVTVYDREALLFDRGTNYKLVVVVYDSAYPAVRDTAEIGIAVLRNINTPIFTTNTYEVTIPDTYELGTNITQVSASDSDGNIVKYEVIGDTRALEFYYVNPDNGVISLKKLLTEGSQPTDTLTIRARDQGVPEKFGNCLVIVTIKRDDHAPVFTRVPYRATVQRLSPVNMTVIRAIATDQDLQGTLHYEILGNYPAPSFFQIDAVLGDITIKRPLAFDSLLTNTYYVSRNK
ncbi:protocadherin Fat 4-like [Haliotis rubra]|uniref:protocadherin Fat 4-like n=1 Tax=Haliotis rubra TaxID=36100 RepID=UPI001EE5A995|nr:protocadherin Fat 4-like [Haliotis rubra]